MFTDVTLGEQHEVDLVMKAKLRDTEAFFLVHVENQAKAQAEFPKRMFRYFARLTEKYDLPVYPVVVFSYDAPQRPEPHEFRVSFPGRTVLRFDYAVIQLNRLPWRRFVRQPNPVAAALMAKMKMAERERSRVKLECLRLLATLRLDPARTKLIGGFIESYLDLSAQEMKQYERELEALQPQERQTTMALVSSWEQRGIEQGISQGIEQGIDRGKRETVALFIQVRFGTVPAGVTARLHQLTSGQSDELVQALPRFDALADLERWLSQH